MHAISGGVGLAAVCMMPALGARTMGTAGSSSKRASLRRVGAGLVLGSRDTTFASEATALLAHPHVVLNSLTSPGMIGASLATLACGGRYDLYGEER